MFKSKKIKIVHIAAHIGGGVGSVLKDYFSISKNYNNILLCLDYCINNSEDIEGVDSFFEGCGYNYLIQYDKLIKECDILMIHYWNHPLMVKFLIDKIFPPCRVLIWCHNSGLFEPHIIPSYLKKISEKIIFTSSCSYQAPNIANLSNEKNNNILSIHSTRSLTEFINIGVERKNLNKKRLLYVGTVSKAKMHSETPLILSKLIKLGFEVCIVGGPDHKLLKSEVSKLNADINVVGSVKNVVDYFESSDLFIYPLRNDHYGTGEQVILEAMASGLPVVAFNNLAEKSIITNNVDGFLVSSADEFIEVVCKIFSNNEAMILMSKNALNSAQNKFSIQKMVQEFDKVYDEALLISKKEYPKPFSYPEKINGLSLYALNSFFTEKIFEDIIHNGNQSVKIVFEKFKSDFAINDNLDKWFCSSKSTPYHYLKYFPNDNDLKLLCSLIDSKFGKYYKNN